MSADEGAPVVIKNRDEVLAVKKELSLTKQASSDPAQELELKRRMSIIIDPTGMSKNRGKTHQYQHKTSFIFAFLASITFGTCNIT